MHTCTWPHNNYVMQLHCVQLSSANGLTTMYVYNFKEEKSIDPGAEICHLKVGREGKVMPCYCSRSEVGKTQIQSIVGEEKTILKRWESGEWSDQMYCKPRRAGYEDLDKVVLEWFTVVRSKNIPVSDRIIQEKARM